MVRHPHLEDANNVRDICPIFHNEARPKAVSKQSGGRRLANEPVAAKRPPRPPGPIKGRPPPKARMDWIDGRSRILMTSYLSYKRRLYSPARYHVHRTSPTVAIRRTPGDLRWRFGYGCPAYPAPSGLGGNWGTNKTPMPEKQFSDVLPCFLIYCSVDDGGRPIPCRHNQHGRRAPRPPNPSCYHLALAPPTGFCAWRGRRNLPALVYQ